MDSTPPTETWARNAIEQLLVRAATTNDPQDSVRFVDALLEAPLLVPGRREAEGSFTPMTVVSTPPDGREVSEAVAFTHQDRLMTALQRLGAAAADLVMVTVVGRELFTRVLATGRPLVLNPHNDYGKQFLPAEMSDRLAGRDPAERSRVTAAETSVLVGAPAHTPPGLLDRLTRYFDTIGGVSRAHLGWIVYPDGLQSYLLGVVGVATREQVNAGMASVAGDLGTLTMDVSVVAEGRTTIVDAVPPFYRR